MIKGKYRTRYGQYGLFPLEELTKIKYCPHCGDKIVEEYPGDYVYSLLCDNDECGGFDFLYSDIYGSVVQLFNHFDAKEVARIERERGK